MARDPGSVWAPLPEAGAPDGYTKTQLIFHATGGTGSARAIRDNWFGRADVVVESTFIVGKSPADPTLQMMDSTDNADANSSANQRAISVEVVCTGSEPYTEWQVSECIRLGRWAAANHPIAKRICPAHDQSGFGWHVMFGAPGPWTPAVGKVPLTVDTVIPTGRGPVLLADVTVGDTVYDENGEACTVLETHDVMPERAYRLTFDDGAEVTASDTHLWSYVSMGQLRARCRERRVINGKRASTASHKKAARNWATWSAPATTAELAERAPGTVAIPVVEPVRSSKADLPLDPYLLGLWLGDGGSRDGTMCASPADYEEVSRWFIDGGFPTGAVDVRERVVVWRPLGLETALRALGVLGNKHVPAAYLSAAYGQRVALLAGLLDTDGHIAKGKANRVEFVNKNEALADAVVYLAASLGYKPRKAEKMATFNGAEYGPYYRISWRATGQCFGLERKASQYRHDGGSVRANTRRIVKAVEVMPTPMRCLTVDSPNAVFCATEHFIPTHNCPGAPAIAQLKTRIFPAIFAATPPEDELPTVKEVVTGLLDADVSSAYAGTQSFKNVTSQTWTNSRELLKQVAGLSAAVAKLASAVAGDAITAEELKAAVKQGIAESIVQVDVNVSGQQPPAA